MLFAKLLPRTRQRNVSTGDNIIDRVFKLGLLQMAGSRFLKSRKAEARSGRAGCSPAPMRGARLRQGSRRDHASVRDLWVYGKGRVLSFQPGVGIDTRNWISFPVRHPHVVDRPVFTSQLLLR